MIAHVRMQLTAGGVARVEDYGYLPDRYHTHRDDDESLDCGQDRSTSSDDVLEPLADADPRLRSGGDDAYADYRGEECLFCAANRWRGSNPE